MFKAEKKDIFGFSAFGTKKKKYNVYKIQLW